MRFAIIGAGIAGLAAADELKRHGHSVTLFDKGRGAGGRMSTRRAETAAGELTWDHGAQYFTARSDDFRARLAPLFALGHVAIWSPRLVDVRFETGAWRISEQAPRLAGDEMYVGTPSMNSVIKAMAEPHEVYWSSRVTGIELAGTEKHLLFEDGRRQGAFDSVISAIPAEQASQLLAPVSDRLANEASQVSSAPCWAVMLAFDTQLPVNWYGARVHNAPLSWIARNSTKPGRTGLETVVLHASPEWSAANVDLRRDEVVERLTRLFRELSGAPQPVYSTGHRWLLAMVKNGVGEAFGWDARVNIGTVGDWRIAPRVEAAWQSGHSLGEFLTG
ncbi:FAD-dependent oxidoreductase [Henriciella sp. AS95]|uniref:NAD(P)/FAD-dependent oxidoreductase n=1 Tax=Henriciella sp. AS95 TaxID=3135782 RepID=UPI003176532C